MNELLDDSPRSESDIRNPALAPSLAQESEAIKPVLGLRLNNSGPLRLLCLGAHCDDIEIGCGGTILKLAAAGRKIEVHWVVFSSDEQRKQEALKSADAFLCDVTTKKVTVHRATRWFFSLPRR